MTLVTASRAAGIKNKEVARRRAGLFLGRLEHQTRKYSVVFFKQLHGAADAEPLVEIVEGYGAEGRPQQYRYQLLAEAQRLIDHGRRLKQP